MAKILRQRKQNYVVFVVACVVFAVFLLASILFIYWMSDRNTEQSVNSLNDAVGARKAAVEQQIEGNFQVLQGVAIGLSALDMDNHDAINHMLDEVNRTNQFVRMGLANMEGIVDLVDIDGTTYAGMDLSDYEFFQQALEGESAVSETVPSVVNGEEVNYYAIPFTSADGAGGVLCAANDATVLKNILDLPVFQGTGYFTILNDRGTIVSPVGGAGTEVRTGMNIFSLAEFSGHDANHALETLAIGQNGSYHLTFEGQEEWLVVQPMNVNGWSVACLIPQAAVDRYYNSTALGAAALIIGACLLFLFLMYWQLRMLSRNQAALEQLAYTDMLTGARNYQKFLLDAQRLLRAYPDKKYAIWSYDIKKFNAINGIFGNAVGDRVLKRVADVFENTKGESDIFCRVSADQFVGMWAYEEKKQLEDWFWRVIEELADRKVISANQMRIDDAIGFYCVEDFPTGLPVNEMVNSAAVAKKAAKAEAGNQLRFFSLEMNKQVRWESTLEAGGRQALERGEITFFLQPKVAIQGEFHIAGAEVLARWNHPTHGLISPGEFIPLFEKNGFIIEVDRYLFEQTCAWYARCREQGMAPFQLAINVSRQGLLRDDFISYYAAVKEKYSIPDGVLELEFTESMILEDYELFLCVVEAMQEKGFVCSIDDFGSGYSSLNVLKNLPINVLKLDAVFFRDGLDAHREEVVVENFIHMARQLQIRTVAEGVEKPSQVAFLQRIGCDVIQGYIFSKPLQQQDFLSLLNRDGGRVEMQRV